MASHLDQSLGVARIELEGARRVLEDARIPLLEAEKRAKNCWARKKAARVSLEVTRRGAAAAGLAESATTRVALTRIEARIAEESAQIRKIIETSGEICEVFEQAWDGYIRARSAEIEVLKAIAESKAVTSAKDADESRKQVADKAVREAERSLKSEQTQRLRELVLPDEAHYDPRYNALELWERRNRKWLD